jgi:hypothetical protein
VSPLRFARGAARGVVCALVCALAGCGTNGPKMFAVNGAVFVGDQPAEGATVVFQPKATEPGALTPSGTVGADGTFRVSTHPHGEGAPPGEYAVLVTWYPADARGQDNPKNKLAAKYADPKQTPFRVTVEAKSNELEPFRIGAK